MGEKFPLHEGNRQGARRTSSRDSVFLLAITDSEADSSRTVVREDVHERALESARQVLQNYRAERRRAL